MRAADASPLGSSDFLVSSGNSLSITEVNGGVPSSWSVDYFNSTDAISCGLWIHYAGGRYGPCAGVAFNDAQTGTETWNHNQSTSAHYDACGNLIGGSTSFGWYTVGDPEFDLTSGGYVGGNTEVIPANACSGYGTIVYSFTQTFRDGTMLTANSTGTFRIQGNQTLAPAETYGGGNPAELPGTQTCVADPVNTATGDFWESTTDLAIGGRGPGLRMERTYSSLAAAAGHSSPLGRGWSFGYGMSLAVEAGSGNATITHGNGSQTAFASSGSGGYTAPERVLARLVRNGDGTWTYTVRERTTYTFSGAGRLTGIADLNGNTIALAYDGSGRLLTATDGAGRTLSFAYDSAGLISSVTDSTGRSVDYAHNAAGDLTTVTDARDEQWEYTYDSSHLLLTREDPNAKSVTNTYDAGGRTLTQTNALDHTTTFAYTGHPSIDPLTSTRVTDPRGNVTRYDYLQGIITEQTCALGTPKEARWIFEHDRRATLGLTKVTDPNGHITRHIYDSRGNRTSTTTPLNHTASASYDALNNPISETDEMGVTTTHTYDVRGNRLTSSTPLSGTSQTQTLKWSYAPNGDVTSFTDPNGKVTTMTYTAAGDLASATDPLGNKTTYTYDALGRPLTRVSPRGNATGAIPADFTAAYTYDPAGNLLTSTDPLGRESTRTYDAVGNLLTVTDPEDHTTTYGYDGVNRRVTTTRPDGTILRTGYDANGNVVSQTNGAEHETTYSYDELDYLASKTGPLNRTTNYSYDTVGNLRSVTDPLARTTNYSYDAADQLKQINYSDAATPDVGYGYDPAGRTTSMSDGSGSSSFTYDSLGRLTKTINGGAKSTTFAYNLAGDQTAITYPNGKKVTRTFDNAGRMASITDWLNKKTTFTYDADSQLTKTTFPSTTTNADTYTYNRAGELMSVSMKRGTSTLASLSYTHNANGQVTSETPTGLPGGTQSFTYNQLNRLSEATTKTYSYDAADNPTTQAGIGGFTYNAANELTQSPTATYTYDSLGQRTQLTPTSGPATTYGYDQAGHLTSSAAPSTTTYRYDGMGLRTAKTTGGTTSNYVWDRSSPLPMLLTDGSTSYIYGPNGTPLQQITSNNTVTYYHHDQLGSTRLLTNSTGTAAASFSYDPYGNTTGQTGTTTTPLRYQGQFLDPETGLYYLRARYYDPSTAQFLTRDPLEDISNQPYLYANGDPVNLTDPTGLIFGAAADWVEDRANDGLDAVLPAATNLAAGFGDGATGLVSDTVNTLTLGHVDLPTTYDVREAMGTNDAVDFCSSWYSGGQVAGQATVGLAAGSGGLAVSRFTSNAWRVGRGGKDLIVSRKRVPTGGRKWRISPTGHRPNPNASGPAHWGRNLPHYHRRPGIGKHRPWEGGF
jgi:RHS repeat-associated protein